MKGHIDAIASKYIRPAEGTFDFAFMYLPSEAVYYELVCGKTGNLSAYAHGKRVIAVSPGTLHAYLLMVTQGLRALQIERHAQEVMAFCAQIGKDFDRFRGDFEVVGKHIANAQTKYSEADRRLDRLGTSLERATEWEPEAVEAAAGLPPPISSECTRNSPQTDACPRARSRRPGAVDPRARCGRVRSRANSIWSIDGVWSL